MSFTHSNITPYINRLPTELLRDVFKRSSIDIKKSIQPLRTEIDISSVCKRWRYIALDMPTLWTSIDAPRQTPLAVDMVRLYVNRSQSQPLHFHATLTSSICHGSRVSYTEHRELVEVLLSCVDRWKHLSISIHQEVNGDLAPAILSKFTELHTPLLETFTLECSEGNGLLWFDLPVHIFQLGAPKLAHVEFRGMFDPTICQVPFTTLTSFSFETLHFDVSVLGVYKLFVFLGWLPALTHLALSDLAAYDVDHHPDTVELLNLVSLQVMPSVSCYMGDILSIIGAISAPNLRHFSLSFQKDEDISNDEDEQEHVDILFAPHTYNPPFPVLDSLDLHIPSTPDVAIHCFAAFPSVTSVSISHRISMVMITAMANDSPITLWPNLRVLILENWSDTHQNNVLLDLLRARQEAKVPIRRLVLRTQTDTPLEELIPASLLSQLREFVDVDVENRPRWYCRHGYLNDD